MTECTIKGANSGFDCTGYDGKHIWKKLHDLPKEIDCENCADHATLEFNGLHDHVNLGLGKSTFNKPKYEEWYNEVIAVHTKCKIDGRC